MPWLAVHAAAWLTIAITAVAVASTLQRPPQAPAITEDLFQAGSWARAHVPANCIEYLVSQDSTSYWLRHAVLGNSMEPANGTPPPVFVYRDPLVRALVGTSLPWAIAGAKLSHNPSLIPRCERARRASHANGPPSRRRRFGEVSPEL